MEFNKWLYSFIADCTLHKVNSDRVLSRIMDILHAIPKNSDLSKIHLKLTVWEWRDEENGLRNLKEFKDDKELCDACEEVVVLYERLLNGEDVSNDILGLIKKADTIYSRGDWAGTWKRQWLFDKVRMWKGNYEEIVLKSKMDKDEYLAYQKEYPNQVDITINKVIELIKEPI